MPIRRGLVALAAAALLATLATVAVGAPAQAASYTPINVWNSSHCLDNATQNAAKLQMWSCTGGSEQRWLEVFDPSLGLFMFTNQHTGWCIVAPAFSAGIAGMAPCNPSSTAQYWRVFAAGNPLGSPSGWYDVWQNVASGYCLTTPSVGNGTLLQTTTCDPSDQYDRWHQQ